MADDPNKVVVPDNLGIVGSIQAAIRLVVFLMAAFTAIAGFVKTRDLAGLANYIQTNGGQILTAGSTLVAMGVAFYGIFRTGKLGKLLEKAAADPANQNVVSKTDPGGKDA